MVPSFLSLLFIFFSLDVYANSDLSANSDSVNIIAIIMFLYGENFLQRIDLTFQ